MGLGPAIAVVLVHSLDRSLRFYRDTLGLTVQHEQDGWATFLEGVLLLTADEPIPEDRLSFSTVGVAFTVADITAEFARLTKRGVAFLVPPSDVGGAIVASFRDPDGNHLQLMQRLLV